MTNLRTNHWQIAWKRDSEEKYRLIENPKWGWCADPFLVEYKGEIYLFAEIFLYKSERNGVIGYCKLIDDGWSEWTVSMDRHWHLSYPNVWVEKGKLLMCPESYQAGEVSVYELTAFPDKWVKIRTLISNVPYCDTTFLIKDDDEYMFTYERGTTGAAIGRGILYRVTDEGLVDMQIFSESREGNRCGGKIIEKNDRFVRVAQNCSGGYGRGLIFYEIDAMSPLYKEHEIKRIMPEDVCIEDERKFVGIHTYNICGDIEVIDLKYSFFSISEYIARKRVNKIFVEKY